MDNLQSTTYEVFEKDPVKYDKYEEVGAVHRSPTIRFLTRFAGCFQSAFG